MVALPVFAIVPAWETIPAASRSALDGALDYLVVSHFHSDHMGGVADLAQRRQLAGDRIGLGGLELRQHGRRNGRGLRGRHDRTGHRSGGVADVGALARGVAPARGKGERGGDCKVKVSHGLHDTDTSPSCA